MEDQNHTNRTDAGGEQMALYQLDACHLVEVHREQQCGDLDELLPCTDPEGNEGIKWETQL